MYDNFNRHTKKFDTIWNSFIIKIKHKQTIIFLMLYETSSKKWHIRSFLAGIGDETTVRDVIMFIQLCPRGPK